MPAVCAIKYCSSRNGGKPRLYKHFPCACITLEQTFLVLGLPLSSSNDLPSRLPSSPPPRYPTHHISTPSSLPSSAPVHLAGHLPNTGKFKPTHKNSTVHALLNSILFWMTRVLFQVTPDRTSPTMRQHLAAARRTKNGMPWTGLAARMARRATRSASRRKPRSDAGSQALRKHKDRDWNFQVLQCIERGQRQAATERSPGSKLMLRLAMQALRCG